jgi:hypothetical protein
VSFWATPKPKLHIGAWIYKLRGFTSHGMFYFMKPRNPSLPSLQSRLSIPLPYCHHPSRNLPCSSHHQCGWTVHQLPHHLQVLPLIFHPLTRLIPPSLFYLIFRPPPFPHVPRSTFLSHPRFKPPTVNPLPSLHPQLTLP